MLNSSLMDILKALNPSELKGLSEYIHSPFFNKNRNVIKLFDYIYKQAPHFSEEKMNKEAAYRKIFGEGRFNDGFMRTLIFIITKLSEEYLAYLNFKSDRFNQHTGLLDELFKRNVSRILAKNIKSTEKKFSAEKNKDEKYFRAMYKLTDLKNESQVLKGKTLNSKEVNEDLTPVLMEYHVKQFLITSINNFIFILNRKHLVNIKHDLVYLDEILAHLEKNLSRYSDIPLLMLLYNQLRLNLEPDNEFYYRELKKVVLSDSNSLSYLDRYNGIIGLQNFCMKQYNSGNQSFLMEYFNMLDYILKGRYYSNTEGGDLFPQNFKNFVIVALNLKKFDWAENFIKQYSKKLDISNRENAYNFSMAKLYFAKREFEKALGFISRVSYQDLYYKLDVRHQTLMIHYELGMFNEAFDLMDSYKKFIVNSKLLSALMKKKHLFFLKYSNELFRIRLSGKPKKIKQIEKEIKNSVDYLGVSWLLLKLSELSKKLSR
jgi:hypothetical protein